VTTLSRTEAAAQDLLTGAQAIPVNQASICSLNRDWTTPATYLEWARRGYRDGDEHGLANAITYAKRAACCRIDWLVHNYHLQRIHRAPFPIKIQALESVGIAVPSVIQELIINPRNELEHDYVPANADTARRALDIAALFLDATEAADKRDSIIALNMNILYSYSSKDGKEHVAFNGWRKGVMLFMDIFAEPQTAKIIDAENRALRYAELANFTREESIQLARILHSHHSLQNRGSSSAGPFFYTEIKRLAGF